MDQDRSSSPSQAGMQFDQAEIAEDAVRKFECAFCEAPLTHSYFELNGQPACEGCRYKVDAEMAVRPGVRGFLKAAMAGAGAAAVGAGLYYAVRALTGYEIGIVAIVVGFLVGRAVRWGSKSRGGWVYQTLAMGLTYLAIASTYLPMIIEQVSTMQPPAEEQTAVPATPVASATPADGPAKASPAAARTAAAGAPAAEEMGVGGFFLGLGFLVLFAAAVPFLAGFENLIGLLIIGIGMYEAWRYNKRLVLNVEGPFEIRRLAEPQALSGTMA